MYFSKTIAYKIRLLTAATIRLAFAVENAYAFKSKKKIQRPSTNVKMGAGEAVTMVRLL